MDSLFEFLTNKEEASIVKTGIIALFLQVLFLPFFNITITQVTGIYVGLIAFYIFFKKRKMNLDVIAFGSLFLVTLVWSFFYFDWRGLGRGVDAYYLLFTTPLFLYLLRLDVARIRFLFWTFILGTVAAYFLTISVGLYHYLNEMMPPTGRLTDILFHEQLSYIILDAHPTYFSLYGCIATLLIIYFPNKHIWVNLVLVTFITLAITLLMARITLLIQCLFVALFFGKIIFTSWRWRLILVPVVLLLFFTVYFKAVNTYDYQHRKIFVDFKASWERSKEPNLTITEWGIVTRFALWRASWEVVEANRWFGIKPKTEKEALSAQLRINSQDYIASLEMDSHNFYLSTLLAYGFIGVFILLAAQLFLVWRSDFYMPYLVFVAIIALVCCTEGVFLRFVGTSFFAIIGSLLFFYKKSN